jgi:hypothetical protein
MQLRHELQHTSHNHSSGITRRGNQRSGLSTRGEGAIEIGNPLNCEVTIGLGGDTIGFDATTDARDSLSTATYAHFRKLSTRGSHPCMETAINGKYAHVLNNKLLFSTIVVPSVLYTRPQTHILGTKKTKPSDKYHHY